MAFLDTPHVTMSPKRPTYLGSGMTIDLFLRAGEPEPRWWHVAGTGSPGSFGFFCLSSWFAARKKQDILVWDVVERDLLALKIKITQLLDNLGKKS